MIVCVYGAASNKIDKKYMEKCQSLGKALAQRGHSLVYGAGADGLMGASARGFKAGGGYIHGVIPHFFELNGYEGIFYEADKITRTDTMEERKAIMENECQAFIVVPGGIGTFDEFFQILTLKQLGQHKKAIALYNIDGYYDKLLEALDYSIKHGFVNQECQKLYRSFSQEKELIEYVENYNANDIKWNELKGMQVDR